MSIYLNNKTGEIWYLIKKIDNDRGEFVRYQNQKSVIRKIKDFTEVNPNKF